jgi:hypothetical protein
MTHMKRRISSMTLAALTLALASVVLAACGSSSSSTTVAQSATTSPGTGTSTSPGTTTPGAKSSTPGGLAGRFSAFRECMQKQGITLPQRKPGQPGGGLLGGAGAAPALPAGVTRAQYEAALQKCAALRPRFPGRVGGPGQRPRSPAFAAALVKFGACMRENGVALPAPNTTGKGPVFSTKGISTTTPQFRTAESKCAPLLRQGLSRPGAGGPPGERGQTG